MEPVSVIRQVPQDAFQPVISILNVIMNGWNAFCVTTIRESVHKPPLGPISHDRPMPVTFLLDRELLKYWSFYSIDRPERCLQGGVPAAGLFCMSGPCWDTPHRMTGCHNMSPGSSHAS